MVRRAARLFRRGPTWVENQSKKRFQPLQDKRWKLTFLKKHSTARALARVVHSSEHQAQAGLQMLGGQLAKA